MQYCGAHLPRVSVANQEDLVTPVVSDHSANQVFFADTFCVLVKAIVAAGYKAGGRDSCDPVHDEIALIFANSPKNDHITFVDLIEWDLLENQFVARLESAKHAGAAIKEIR